MLLNITPIIPTWREGDTSVKSLAVILPITSRMITISRDVGPPVASYQHPVLSLKNIGADLAFHSFSFSFHLVRRCMLTDRTEKCRLNKKLLKVGHVGSKGGSSLVNHLVD